MTMPAAATFSELVAEMDEAERLEFCRHVLSQGEEAGFGPEIIQGARILLAPPATGSGILDLGAGRMV